MIWSSIWDGGQPYPFILIFFFFQTLTRVQVVELEEVALLVQLVGVTVEEAEDRLQLGQGVEGDFHHGRAVGLDHRRRA